ncbi:MAG TPA: cob(I)yrinic acid a,c-diamide adenosyltransferase [Spirochaetia bacterium]|nr:cob(I)yrinic acid a,c-diamide adenosyltransferase [Spirochaetia bacterium]
MIEFDRVTTRGGDGGESSLYNGERRRKDDLVFHALGDVDETSACIGIARAYSADSLTRDELFAAQQVLFKVGAQLATPSSDPLHSPIKPVEQSDIDRLERSQRVLMARVDLGSEFVTPGDTILGAHIDHARTVVRRAERTVVQCIRDRHMFGLALAQNYLNRLSDYLFVLARAADQRLVEAVTD